MFQTNKNSYRIVSVCRNGDKEGRYTFIENYDENWDTIASQMFYDESEYCKCPYCSGELEEEHGEKDFKSCPNCGGVMYWDDSWICTNCGEEIDTGKDDNDGIMEY